MQYSRVRGRLAIAALACATTITVGCNQQATPESAAVEPDVSAVPQDERDDAIAGLEERVATVEREYTEASQEVASGEADAAAGLREELKEDVQNVREAVENLATTTPENWWDRHEQAIERTVQDIEADVRRLAGAIPEPSPRPEATAGDAAAAAPFESRRDQFVDTLRTRVDAMEQALADIDAKGVKETEVEDTRARVQKLGEDVDRLRSASADDWWDVSEARVAEYVARVEESIGRLDDNEPSTP